MRTTVSFHTALDRARDLVKDLEMDIDVPTIDEWMDFPEVSYHLVFSTAPVRHLVRLVEALHDAAQMKVDPTDAEAEVIASIAIIYINL